ncbi:DMT family transporter [Streptomyces sp. NPDC006632]|uniref:DMT family transporter n=1 Tax=Streptomyces sp. NPDC006632 TaxID=3157182 RepID=UPI0033A9733B
MTAQNSATPPVPVAVPTAVREDGHRRPALPRGTALATLGVLSFSLTFPSTAWGLESFGTWSMVSLRLLIAALLAGVFLWRGRVPFPDRSHWGGFAVVVGGVMIGFPVLTTLALGTATTSHAAVVVGLLPLTTAAFAALRTRRRPSRAFWTAALAGAAVVVVFTVQQSGGELSRADLYLFAALLLCAAGYTEGGRLSGLMPGWHVVGWALVLCVPLTVTGTVLGLTLEPWHLTVHGVVGLLWVASASTFLGLYLWYRGMAAIGVAKASQLQLAQPLLTLVWSVLLLGEHLSPAAPLAAAGVLVCIAVTQRARS